MFTDSIKEMRRWSSQARPDKFAKTTCVEFVFDNASTVLSAGASRIYKAGFTGFLNTVEIFTDVSNANAVFSLTYGDKFSWPLQTPLHGIALSPRIAGLLTPYYSGELDLTEYFRYIRINDVFFCRLVSVTLARSVTLALTYKLLEAPGFGGSPVVDDVSGEQLTLDDGTPLDFRF